MDLYLVRHAPAVPRAPMGDAGRPLSERGRQRFAGAVRSLGQSGVRFERIWTSPWQRALETARLLAPLCPTPPCPSESLAAPPRTDLLALLEGPSAALVGHEPWMTDLLAWLCTGDQRLAAGFRMGKGSVAHLRGEPVPGQMVLRSLVPLGTLRRLDPGPNEAPEGP